MSSADRVARSAAAGVAATVAMTVAMMALERALPGRRERGPGLPPRKVAVGVARRVGVASELGHTQRSVLTWISHFAYGTTAASVFPLVARRLRAAPPVVRGMAYGLAVWAASYAGWLPALGILGRPTRWPWHQNTLIIAAHLVWGGVLGLLMGKRRGW